MSEKNKFMAIEASEDQTVRLRLFGEWMSPHWEGIVDEFTQISLDQKVEKLSVIDAEKLEKLDLSGALCLCEYLKKMGYSFEQVVLENFADTYKSLIDRVIALDSDIGQEAKAPQPFLETLNYIGARVFSFWKEMLSLLNFFGLFCVCVFGVLKSPKRFRVKSFCAHIEQTGVQALGIVGLLAFLIGVVLAFQSADQLRQFGAELLTVDLLGISILREIGILITAIIVAGRSGSAFTAQIGTMKANQEIDALQVLGLNPTEILAIPRVFALVVTLPLLAFYASVIAILGGAAMVWLLFDISWIQFYSQFKADIGVHHLWVGLIKAPFFAVIIALVGCYQGLNVSGSAESVGQKTTESVVSSIFLVIICDAIFSVLFSYMGV